MIFAHAVADVRAAEAALMAQLPEGALMQRAASGLAAVCARVLRGEFGDGLRSGGHRRRRGGPYGARVVLLVGGGDNGGDALWAGARLARRGARVDAVILRHDRVHGTGLAALKDAGGTVVSGDDGPMTTATAAAIRRADLIIDGILGIGGRGGLRPDAAELAEFAASASAHVVAVDLPSGIDVDTGEISGAHVRADTTVTFGTHKVGLFVDPAAAVAGDIELVDIGLGPYLPAPALQVLEFADVARMFPEPDRNADKYRRGVLGLLAGSAQYRGAAVLAAGGAVHGGSGMLRFAGPDAVAADVLRRWPETVVSAEAAEAGRVQAWAVGSGLGEGREHEVAAVLSAGVPVLVDADGLRKLPPQLASPALLTPHAGELARMLDAQRSDVEARRLHYVRQAARRWNATVLLKGSTTLVAEPDGPVRVNPTGSPALATAGSGDVLAGLGGSLLAAGLTTFDAGSVAAFVHGMAGHVAAELSGYPSASDILEALPGVLAELRRPANR
ncbi:NAD(P)H-hydrate dehydratase [Phytoactinopolyspora halotolerans]|uniref:Bifunctional NAD(P)H-hydrate repair enzyme n=1 Tax=Phytoactinopolyspora halotolerans TaxID=1981512 RepID=A0A6L9S680_9ACTN|nr:NAD(P)H-hydrate dehydratase [Phytoactinopolyspora halotolerans]NEE00154.1 NAD(P)H-hydrate dehydratase [Phytoactinopolyspora halotolerans]